METIYSKYQFNNSQERILEIGNYILQIEEINDDYIKKELRLFC